MKSKLPTGPDTVNGGDGLPDWMQFAISLIMFGTFGWIFGIIFLYYQIWY